MNTINEIRNYLKLEYNWDWRDKIGDTYIMDILNKIEEDSKFIRKLLQPYKLKVGNIYYNFMPFYFGLNEYYQHIFQTVVYRNSRAFQNTELFGIGLNLLLFVNESLVVSTTWSIENAQKVKRIYDDKKLNNYFLSYLDKTSAELFIDSSYYYDDEVYNFLIKNKIIKPKQGV